MVPLNCATFLLVCIKFYGYIDFALTLMNRCNVVVTLVCEAVCSMSWWCSTYEWWLWFVMEC